MMMMIMIILMRYRLLRNPIYPYHGLWFLTALHVRCCQVDESPFDYVFVAVVQEYIRTSHDLHPDMTAHAGHSRHTADRRTYRPTLNTSTSANGLNGLSYCSQIRILFPVLFPQLMLNRISPKLTTAVGKQASKIAWSIWNITAAYGCTEKSQNSWEADVTGERYTL